MNCVVKYCGHAPEARYIFTMQFLMSVVFQWLAFCPFGPSGHSTGADYVAESKEELRQHLAQDHHCDMMSVWGKDWAISESNALKVYYHSCEPEVRCFNEPSEENPSKTAKNPKEVIIPYSHFLNINNNAPELHRLLWFCFFIFTLCVVVNTE